MKAMVTLANRRRHNWFELNRIVGKQDAADTHYMATDCQIAVATSNQAVGKPLMADGEYPVAGGKVAGLDRAIDQTNVTNTQASADRTSGDCIALGFDSGKPPPPVEAAPGYPLTIYRG